MKGNTSFYSKTLPQSILESPPYSVGSFLSLSGNNQMSGSNTPCISSGLSERTVSLVLYLPYFCGFIWQKESKPSYFKSRYFM